MLELQSDSASGAFFEFIIIVFALFFQKLTLFFWHRHFVSFNTFNNHKIILTAIHLV